jgi:transposase-like protein|tara:strand:- start:319 stop:1410 length:1092 start_codon:yes stop_codon:yes gene_type:complete
MKCKVCSALSQIDPRHCNKAKFLCPHCQHPLFLWKQRKDVSIYKCDYDKCAHFETNKNKLNRLEKALRRTKSSQFKLRYQFREYHFTQEQLTHSAPKKLSLSSSIFNIRNSLNTLCLALTFHISLGISARKTAFILINVFGIRASYQTILNYTQQAAYYCHNFNLKYKGPVDNTQSGDETYIKIAGKNAYTFFFISPERRKISAYHIDDSRDTLPATIAMKEAIRTADTNQPATFVTDGNPSYPAGIHFLNMTRKDHPIALKKVIGLQNLDSESEKFRPFKQLIERLNRTYKFHIKAANGFNSKNGAVALTALFVTYYNFMRPHSTLKYSVPIPIKALHNISTLQGKWAKILKMATDLDLATA